MKPHYFLYFLLICLFSCGKKGSKTVTSTSPSGEATISIHGTKTPMDPWTTVIVAEGYGHKDSVTTEIYSDDLNDSTVKITWSDKNQAVINFSQTDGVNRKLAVEISPKMLKVGE